MLWPREDDLTLDSSNYTWTMTVDTRQLLKERSEQAFIPPYKIEGCFCRDNSDASYAGWMITISARTGLTHVYWVQGQKIYSAIWKMGVIDHVIAAQILGIAQPRTNEKQAINNAICQWEQA